MKSLEPTTASGLEAAKSYFCQIHAFSADLTAPLTTPIANQNNLSFRRTAITLP